MMGGPGSRRRWHYSAKNTTNDYRRLDVRRLQRDGLLTPGRFFDWKWKRQGEVVAAIQVRTEINSIILIYRHRRGDGEWQDKEYPVQLEWTSCTYGGQRAWFLCPAQGCKRRVAILYGGGVFACRHCYHLAYPSQRESDNDRLARRANKIRDQLGWEPGILNGAGSKPKGMRWHTFERLTTEHNTLMMASLTGMMQRFRIKM